MKKWLVLALTALGLASPANANPLLVPVLGELAVCTASGPVGGKAFNSLFKVIRNHKGQIIKVTAHLAGKVERNANFAWEKGHLVANRFIRNTETVVPMPKEINHGSWLAMENAWAKAVKNGHNVRVKIVPVWKNDMLTGIRVTATTHFVY
jgi:hypothetical protein